MILSCLEKKSDGYSLEGQYPLMEEKQSWRFKLDDGGNFS